MSVRCFWLEPTDRARVALRRYRARDNGACSVNKCGYHNASTPIGECSARIAPLNGDASNMVWHIEAKDENVPHDDPRWPRRCECGYEFVDADEWQVFTDVVYRRLDSGEETTLRDAPAGAMYDAWWLKGFNYKQRGDGIILMVLCPDKCHDGTYAWNVDGPSSNNAGVGWERSGVARSAAPSVTATPSIGCGPNMQCYHGWLRDGWLVEA